MNNSNQPATRNPKAGTFLLILIFIFIFTNCNMPDQPALSLLQKRELQNFSSASAIEFYNDRLYVTGDDSRTMVVLDSSYGIMDTVELFPGSTLRIPKKEKSDLEASAIVHYQNKPHLLVAGSASKTEREVFFLFPLDDLKNYDTIPAHKFCDSLREKGLQIINIEGLATVNRMLVFANRANIGNPHNHLIAVEENVIHQQETNLPRIIQLNLEHEDDTIRGVSGLAYIPSIDLMLFTASVELTENAIDDGSIGDSFLGYITNFSAKMKSNSIKPDQLMNLSTIHKDFRGEKIESVCVESAEKEIILHLVADNDDGTSTLFKVSLANPAP